METKRIEDNIFEVVAVIGKHRDLKMKGDPYLIKGKSKGMNRIYAWDFDYKGNPSRRKGE